MAQSPTKKMRLSTSPGTPPPPPKRFFILEFEREELEWFTQILRIAMDSDKTIAHEEPLWRWLMYTQSLIAKAMSARSGDVLHRAFVGNSVTFITIPRVVDI